MSLQEERERLWELGWKKEADKRVACEWFALSDEDLQAIKEMGDVNSKS